MRWVEGLIVAAFIAALAVGPTTMLWVWLEVWK